MKLAPAAKEAQGVIGQRIRMLRLARELTQCQLAEAIDGGTTYISDLELGKTRDPRISTLRLIALALGTSVAHLIGDD